MLSSRPPRPGVQVHGGSRHMITEIAQIDVKPGMQ
jgi:hypothetical protein